MENMFRYPDRLFSPIVAGAILSALALARPGFADDRWDGGGGDGAWSTDANWVDNVAPPVGGGGVIVFDNAGMGTNTVDQDWTLASLFYSNNVASGHTTVVADARTLLINGANGSLTIGNAVSNCVVAIQGGTVQLGDDSQAVSLQVGVTAVANTTNTYPPILFTLTSALNAYNLRNVHIGRRTSATAGGIRAEADLSGCTISQGAVPNRLKASELVVGGGNGYTPIGVLRLPPSLEEIELGLLEMAGGGTSLGGEALVDFGAGSQLRKFAVSNTFYLARNGFASLANWPAGVTVLVGTADSPALMHVGCTENEDACGASLVLTNGSFTAYLTALRVGQAIGSSGSTTGILDLTHTAVQIGGTPNAVRVPSLVIGGGLTGYRANGNLRLPPEVTSLNVDTLDMASGRTSVGGTASLDLGENSQLRTFTVSNAFYLAKNGRATISNWPAGVTVAVGSVLSPAVMTIGCGEGTAGFGVLSLTNGLFTAYLSYLKVGSCTGTSVNATGILDLAQTAVQIGDTPNAIHLPELRVGGGIDGYLANGTLRLPPEITAISVDTLDLASGRTTVGGKALLDFGVNSQLRTLTVSNAFFLAKNGKATLANWPAGITVTVGSADSPAVMSVGCTESSVQCGASLGLTNGRFTAHLSYLKIGCATNTGNGSTTGTLDLAQTLVQIGDTPNAVRIPELRVGGGISGYRAVGSLLLPPEVTSLNVDTFDLASGLTTVGGTALLDLGANSQLRDLTVSNAFFLTRNGRTTLAGWPAGVTVTVGSADSPAAMTVGCSEGTVSHGTLSLTGGCFNARLSSLTVGANNNRTAGAGTGVLNLAQTTLAALDVAGDFTIAASTATCISAKGYVTLPAGDATVGGNLLVGDTHAASAGRLELFGTQVQVTSNVIVEATGAITNHVVGYPGGLSLLSADSNSLAIAAGGRVHVAFDAEPASTRGYYWGLRMAGDQTAYFADLNAAGKLTWSLGGLSAASQARFGIFYRPTQNETLLGLPPPPGAFLMVR